MTWFVCLAAMTGAFVCLMVSTSSETHKPLRRGDGLDLSTLWSCAALGLMLVAIGALGLSGG